MERKNLKPLWVAGLVIDLSLWALRLGTTLGICASYDSSARGCNGQDYGGAAIPVIGAWIQVSKGIGGDNGLSSGSFALLVGAGILEATGFAMFVAGLVIHRRVIVPGPGDEVSIKLGPIQLVPSVTPRFMGIVGTF